MDVEFYFDPVCTWSWVASRWLIEVAPQRSLRVYWRSFSKLIGQGTQGIRDWDLTSRTASHRALRMIEAVRAEQAEGRLPFSELTGVLADAGLDSRYAAAAYDERWDEAIRNSMADAYAVVGECAGTPVTVLWLDRPVGFKGPLVSPAPTGTDALGLWDAFVQLASLPEVFEISRPRPPRPELSAAWTAPRDGLRALPFPLDDCGT